VGRASPLAASFDLVSSVVHFETNSALFWTPLMRNVVILPTETNSESMKKWKPLFYSCLILLIVSNLFWVYKTIDAGTSMTYQGVTIQDQEQVIEILGELIIEGADNYSQKDILHILRQKYPDGFIVEEQNKIIYEGIHFKFRNDSLVEVTEDW